MYNILLDTRLLRVKLLFYRKIKSKIDIVTMLFVNTFLCDLFLILFLSVLDMEIAALFFSCAAMFFFHFIQEATNLFRALFYVLIFHFYILIFSKILTFHVHALFEKLK